MTQEEYEKYLMQIVKRSDAWDKLSKAIGEMSPDTWPPMLGHEDDTLAVELLELAAGDVCNFTSHWLYEADRGRNDCAKWWDRDKNEYPLNTPTDVWKAIRFDWKKLDR
jgi:hypothetical protein